MAEEGTGIGEASGSRHHRDGQGASWIVGAVLIVLGIVFFLEQGGYVTLAGNWWALFIYLAAAAVFVNMWRAYRATGEFGRQATGSLVWGLVLTVVASIFLFDLVWDRWWPAILVAVGAGIIAGNVLGSATRKPDDTSGE
jgi:hypothetical protein